MILTLEKNQLISRTPGKARSIEVVIPPADLPPLEERSLADRHPIVKPLTRRQKDYLQKQLFGNLMADDD